MADFPSTGASDQAKTLDLTSQIVKVLALQVADGGAKVTGLSNNFPSVFNPTAFGAKVDGVTDDTSAINACLAAIGAASGGVFYQPLGVGGALSLVNGPVIFPTNGAGNPQLLGSITMLGATPPPRFGIASVQPRFGCGWDLRDTGAAGNPAKLFLNQRGTVNWTNFIIADNGTDNFPLVLQTNTNCIWDNCNFMGNPTVYRNAVSQRAVGLGGSGLIFNGTINAGQNTLTATAPVFDVTMVGWMVRIVGAGVAGADLVTTIAVGGFTDASHVTLAAIANTSVAGAVGNTFGYFSSNPYSGFQGYATSFRNCLWDHVDECIKFGAGANSVTVISPAITYSCGGVETDAAPWTYDPTPGFVASGDQADSNVILLGTCEMAGYVYGASFRAAANSNVIAWCGLFDNVGLTAWGHFGATCAGNSIFASQVTPAGLPMGDGPGLVNQLLIGAGVSTQMQLPFLNLVLPQPSAKVTVNTLIAETLQSTNGMVIAPGNGNAVAVKGQTAGAPAVSGVNVYDGATPQAICVQLQTIGSGNGAIRILQGGSIVGGIRGDLGGAVLLPSFTATSSPGPQRPTPASCPGYCIWGSDQNANAGAVLRSDGTNWRNTGTGAIASP